MGLRITIPEGPSVSSRPVSTPYQSLNHDTGLRNVAQGVQQLGAGLQDASRGFEIAKERADVVATNEAQLEFERREAWGNSGLRPEKADYDAPPVEGYFTTQGMAASEHGAKSQEWLGKQRADIEKSLKSDSQKALFRKRSDDYLLQVQRRMQTHESQQVRVAEVATAQASRELKLQSLAYNYADDGLAETMINDQRGTIHALALSPQHGNAEDAQWRTDAVKARIGAALHANDWKTAERLYTGAEPLLAGSGIGDAIRKKRIDVQSEELAQGLVEGNRDERTGRVKDANATRAVDTVPEELREEVRQRVEHRVMVADKLWKAETDAIGTKAFSYWNEANGNFAKIPDELKTQLNARDPELYARLKDKSRALNDRWRKNKHDDAAERRAQSQDNAILANRFAALPLEEQKATDVGAWVARQPDALTADKLGVSALELAKANAGKKVEKGQAESEEDFMRDARAAAVSTKSVSGKREAEEYAAKARGEFDKFVAKNGRPPSKAEAEQLIAAQTSVRKVPRTLFGLSIGEKDVPGWKAGAEAPTAAAVGAARKAIPTKSKRDRALELKAAGKSNADIAKTLNGEGY